MFTSISSLFLCAVCCNLDSLLAMYTGRNTTLLLETKLRAWRLTRFGHESTFSHRYTWGVHELPALRHSQEVDTECLLLVG